MPVLLMTPDEIDRWLEGNIAEIMMALLDRTA